MCVCVFILKSRIEQSWQRTSLVNNQYLKIFLQVGYNNNISTRNKRFHISNERFYFNKQKEKNNNNNKIVKYEKNEFI